MPRNWGDVPVPLPNPFHQDSDAVEQCFVLVKSTDGFGFGQVAL
jgi:hypothetical protein